jgi:hypothetical protein
MPWQNGCKNGRIAGFSNEYQLQVAFLACKNA